MGRGLRSAPGGVSTWPEPGGRRQHAGGRSGSEYQDDCAAVPSFAFCLAWWLEHFEILAQAK
jgi:hypothetical protein